MAFEQRSQTTSPRGIRPALPLDEAIIAFMKEAAGDKRRMNGDPVWKHYSEVGEQTKNCVQAPHQMIARAVGYAHDIFEDHPHKAQDMVTLLNQYGEDGQIVLKALGYLTHDKKAKVTYKR